jgi:hypothetical protein
MYEKQIFKILEYFFFFHYFPTFDEIDTFLPAKTSKKSLKLELDRLIKQKRIKNLKLKNENYSRYTPVEYSILTQKSKVKSNNETIEQWNNFIKKQQISKTKLNSLRFRLYIKLLALFPQIKLVGLSGSIAMMSTNLDDDIDLFIITQKKRLFTGRFLAVIIAYLMGLKRKIEQKKAPGKVCLNLFFDESNLRVPKFKHSEYVAHEVLQMKPVIVKGNVYERFLEANRWVQAIFPNSSWIMSKVKSQKSKIQVKSQNYFKNFKLLTLTSNFLLLTFDFIESILKNLQITLINRHRTTELISNYQLWFHPEDFEKKIKY